MTASERSEVVEVVNAQFDKLHGRLDEFETRLDRLETKEDKRDGRNDFITNAAKFLAATLAAMLALIGIKQGID